MKKITFALLLGLIVTQACADEDIERLVEMQQGTFDSAAANPGSPGEDRLVEKRIRVTAPQLGKYVFYQQINHQQDLSVYRQRILILSYNDSTGRLEQVGLALKTPEEFVDAGPEDFGALDIDDLDAFLPKGCELVWVTTDDGFKGHVDPEHCIIVSSRTGKERRIEAESILSKDRLLLAERGFDAESREQLFGTEPGEYLHLGRVD
jgi:hypothetical protein